MRSIERKVRGVGPDGAVFIVGWGRVAEREAGWQLFSPLEVEDYVLVGFVARGAVFPAQIMSISIQCKCVAGVSEPRR